MEGLNALSALGSAITTAISHDITITNFNEYKEL